MITLPTCETAIDTWLPSEDSLPSKRLDLPDASVRGSTEGIDDEVVVVCGPAMSSNGLTPGGGGGGG